MLPTLGGLEVFIFGGGGVGILFVALNISFNTEAMGRENLRGSMYLGDDVPGVQEAGYEAEHAEEEVDEGVEGAEPGFDPDWEGREEDSEEGEEDVGAAAHFWG